MPRNISLLPSRRGTNTLEASPHIAASVTSTGTTTPLVSAVQSASPVAASSSAVSDLETLATARKLILPASSVARPVSRWLGPFRRRYPQHHIYQGVQYWEKGFSDIQFVVENFVDWREKDIVSALVDDSARYVRELAVLRERLDLEECRDWKRHARTFMVKAQGSSQQAQTEYLQKKLSMISAAAKNSRGSSWFKQRDFVQEYDTLKVAQQDQDRVKDTGLRAYYAPPIHCIDTPKAATFSVAEDLEAIEEDDGAQPDTASAAAGESIEMAILNATAAWVEETANSVTSQSGSFRQRPRGLRRVSSLPNI
ncbi:hypothetical protein K466DRAFT_659090 [Polyporus arcularius HHB13444]|uniref:Uncharacterized protein n=1 Tax=Polyporus arcularius HHB13444 TaxID=1314778 RepID=A0A5C3PSJ6_9APHY|nr:hypothetical protein K466DRAFT_659090 [Polyporus arcularius HHB13444]